LLIEKHSFSRRRRIGAAKAVNHLIILPLAAYGRRIFARR
jgi:hypothetical protein